MPSAAGTWGLFILTLGLFALAVMVLTVWGPWLRARTGRAPISWWRLCAMALRREDLNAIVDAHVMAVTGGVQVPLDALEGHVLAHGDVRRTMIATVAAEKAGVDCPFRMASAIDLSGRDAVAAVQDLIRARQEGLRESADALEPEAVAPLVGELAEVAQAVGPPGLVQVGDTKVNAVSDGGYILKGSPVRIVGVRGNMVVVQRTAAK